MMYVKIKNDPYCFAFDFEACREQTGDKLWSYTLNNLSMPLIEVNL